MIELVQQHLSLNQFCRYSLMTMGTALVSQGSRTTADTVIRLMSSHPPIGVY
jgi:hypothetical protein